MAVKPTHTFQISLSDEEYEKLFLKSYQAALPPNALMELFARSLIGEEEAKTAGSEEIEKWFSQLNISQNIPELFHQYLARRGKLINFVELCFKKERAEARCEELRPILLEDGDIASREDARKEIQEGSVLICDCLEEIRRTYAEYKQENPQTKFSIEDAIQSAKNSYASMQTAISGEPYTFPDGSQLLNIQDAALHTPPDKITFDFRNNQVIWKTPEKEGTDSLVSAREMRLLVFDILGEGEHDLSALPDFINTIIEDDVLSKRFYEIEMAQATGSPTSGENIFNGVLKTVEIKATVLEDTYRSIMGMMRDSGGTMGDVIDKLSLHFAPKDAKFAIPLATEELRMCLSGLNPAETKKALIEIAATLMAAMTMEEQDEVYEKIVDVNRMLVERSRALDKGALEKLADALNRLLRRG